MPAIGRSSARSWSSASPDQEIAGGHERDRGHMPIGRHRIEERLGAELRCKLDRDHGGRKDDAEAGAAIRWAARRSARRTGSNVTPAVLICRLLIGLLRYELTVYSAAVSCAGAAEAAEAALAAMEIGDRGAQIVGAEVGPQRVDEAELGVGRLPQQEIGQPLFAAGADEEIDVVLALPHRACQQPARTPRATAARSPRQARGRVGDGVARRVVDRDPQMQPRAGGRAPLGVARCRRRGRRAAGRGGR